VDEALALLPTGSDAVAHFDALTARATVAAWLGSGDDYVRYMERAYVKALDVGRKDLQTIAAQALASAHMMRLELDEAEILLARALELAGESGSVRARVSATLSYAGFLKVKGELGAAQTMMEEVRATAEELGMEPMLAHALMKLGWLARAKDDLKGSEKLFREALRIIATRGDRGLVPDFQAALATTLADLGKIDEGERLALEARAGAVPEDTSCHIFAMTALAIIRAAQERDDEAEELFRSATALAEESELRLIELHPLEHMAKFLRARGRDDEAALYEARIAELVADEPSRTERIA
jgi:ATP/maltotriose-dependent transcriptional regulator MalT